MHGLQVLFTESKFKGLFMFNKTFWSSYLGALFFIAVGLFIFKMSFSIMLIFAIICGIGAAKIYLAFNKHKGAHL